LASVPDVVEDDDGIDADAAGVHDEDDEDDDEEDPVMIEERELFEDFNEPATSDKEGLTVGGVLVTMFAWIAKNKGTDTIATDMWDVLRVLLPSVTCIGTFDRMQKFLEIHMDDTVEIIGVCINSCIGYFDCQAFELDGYKHSHRSYCPKCGEDRYLPGGEKKERKIFYYFPFRPWLQDLFRYTIIVHYYTLCAPKRMFSAQMVDYIE
jgi:hypothetical protein